MSGPPEELLRAREAARILKISPKTVYELALKGEIPCVRFGRSVRFRPSALAQWIEECSRGVA